MERKPYSAGAVKFSFWFMEFRKTVQRKIADIKEPLHIVAEIPRRFAPNFYLALADRLSEEN